MRRPATTHATTGDDSCNDRRATHATTGERLMRRPASDSSDNRRATHATTGERLMRRPVAAGIARVLSTGLADIMYIRSVELPLVRLLPSNSDNSGLLRLRSSSYHYSEPLSASPFSSCPITSIGRRRISPTTLNKTFSDP